MLNPKNGKNHLISFLNGVFLLEIKVLKMRRGLPVGSDHLPVITELGISEKSA